ncbi:hypothetical protein RRG08_019424 [Elysia crispata]|uniref:Uncharacterized protein n=1 Tax=Elysia crispata TaxID=231223 RepID=A0AAE1D923_9GAST|nr:hypothetical protein RRG08_019424 [Elysia crispata]
MERKRPDEHRSYSGLPVRRGHNQYRDLVIHSSCKCLCWTTCYYEFLDRRETHIYWFIESGAMSYKSFQLLVCVFLLSALVCGDTGGGATSESNGPTVSSESPVRDLTTDTDSGGFANDIQASPDEQWKGSNSVKDNTTIVGTTLDPSGVSDNLNHTEPTSELPATTTTLPSQSSDNTTTIDGSITTDTESTDEKPNSTLPGSTEASVTANSSSGAESVVDSTTTVIFNDTMTTQTSESVATSIKAREFSTTQSSAVPQKHSVRISETNLLLVGDSEVDSLFIELTGSPGEDMTGLWLVVHDAEPNGDTHLHVKLESFMDNTGLFVLANSSGLPLQQLAKSAAVFVGLYSEEPKEGLTTTDVLDMLLYSTQGATDKSLEEKFNQFTRFPLIIDYSQLSGLGNQQVSLSRCPKDREDKSNAAFLLTQATRDEENNCAMPKSHREEMWLSLKKQPCPNKLPKSFKDELIGKIISSVNSKGWCGLSRPMVDDMHVSKTCVSSQETRVDVHFIVKSDLHPHLELVKQTYQIFVSASSNKVLELTDGDYFLHNCTQLCQPPLVNPVNHDDSDHKTQVTIGVVLTCVGVFIVVLLVVVLYMRRKRRGILQFRMTRLDEEDDDMIGDMDDFVGNQGPTFRNFR